MSQNKMNHLRKKAAVSKFKPLQEQGIPREDLALQVESDEKAYTPEEVAEILEAVFAPAEGEGNKPPEPPKMQEPPKTKKTTPKVVGFTSIPEGNLNVDYEEWKVSPLYKDVEDNGRTRKVIAGFEKEGARAIRKTRITPDKAEMFNSQSENTRLRLYEVGE